MTAESTLGYQLKACGKEGLPEQITLKGRQYKRISILKHDFFAATALYQSPSQQAAKTTTLPDKLILKLSRQQYFLGIPLLWLGKLICRHESSILCRLSSLPQVPAILSRYGPTGFIYEYIPGDPLDHHKELPESFFDKLTSLLQQVHKQNVVYLDLDKRSNILLGSDDEPHIIDFQISLHIDTNLPILRRLCRHLRNALQQTDFYHLYKHKNKLCSRPLRPEEQDIFSSNKLIKLHRLVAAPLRDMRRRLLRFLSTKDLAATE